MICALVSSLAGLCLGCSKKAEQDAAQSTGDMPAPPQSAPPAEAPPTTATDGRPPHPALPDPLEEAQPTNETLASTTYRWLPGHWIWTNTQYEWQEGLWVYDVFGYSLVPPRWEWDGQEWLFHDAGWAEPGTTTVVYRPTAVPGVGSADTAPTQADDDSATDVYVEPTAVAAYAWTGRYVPPPIVYPAWHPHHHYHHHHGHPRYARQPAYLDPRYDYARRNDYRRDAPAVKHRDRVWTEPGTPRQKDHRLRLGIDGDPGYTQPGPGERTRQPSYADQPARGRSYADQPRREPSYADQPPPEPSYRDRPPREPVRHPREPAHADRPREATPREPPPREPPHRNPPPPHGGPHR